MVEKTQEYFMTHGNYITSSFRIHKVSLEPGMLSHKGWRVVCDRDQVAPKAANGYYLVLYQKKVY